MDASSKFRSKTAHGESVSNGKKSLAGGSRAQFGDFYSVRVIERKNRTDLSADRFPSAFVTQNFSFKKSYELPVTMEQENAGWSDLTESNWAEAFTADLGERPEPTARGFGVSSPSLGASTAQVKTNCNVCGRNHEVDYGIVSTDPKVQYQPIEELVSAYEELD